jgi:hypothetical protein
MCILLIGRQIILAELQTSSESKRFKGSETRMSNLKVILLINGSGTGTDELIHAVVMRQLQLRKM